MRNKKSVLKILSASSECFRVSAGIAYNVRGLCVVALSRNLKLTTTLDRAITQNPCYVPFLFTNLIYKYEEI